MANLRDLKEARGKAKELLDWAKTARDLEADIDNYSNRIKNLERQRAGTKDSRSQAGLDMALSDTGRQRAVLEIRKTDALGKMREAAHFILGKVG